MNKTELISAVAAALPLLRKVDALRGQSLCAEESVHLALKRLIEAVEKQEK